MANIATIFASFALIITVFLFLWSFYAGGQPDSFSLSSSGTQFCAKEGWHMKSADQVRKGVYSTAPFDPKKLYPAFYPYREEFQVAPAYHLSFCRIEKVMTTIFDAIFCYINNSTEFEANNRKISTELWQTRLCAGKNWYTNMTGVYDAIGPQRINFVVVRHPLDRFLSGFADKCLREALRQPFRCYSCNGDMGCFVSALADDMDKMYKRGTYEYSYELHHFAPQTWYCDFNNYLEEFIIIKYETGRQGILNMAYKFDSIFLWAGVPEKIRKEIRKELLVERNNHSTYGKTERFKAEQTLMGNSTLLAQVTRMFYYDFIVFGFDLPILI